MSFKDFLTKRVSVLRDKTTHTEEVLLRFMEMNLISHDNYEKLVE